MLIPTFLTSDLSKFDPQQPRRWNGLSRRIFVTSAKFWPGHRLERAVPRAVAIGLLLVLMTADTRTAADAFFKRM